MVFDSRESALANLAPGPAMLKTHSLGVGALNNLRAGGLKLLNLGWLNASNPAVGLMFVSETNNEYCCSM